MVLLFNNSQAIQHFFISDPQRYPKQVTYEPNLIFILCGQVYLKVTHKPPRIILEPDALYEPSIAQRPDHELSKSSDQHLC